MNTQMQFVNAWVLYLLWIVPVIAWWWHMTSRKMEQKLALFIAPEMQKKLRPGAYTTRQAWQTGLIAGGLFLLLIAAARPQWGTKEEKIYQRGRDLVIALDVSRSMLANDVHPNRLLRAKADIMDLIKELRGDRAALLAFRRRAITLCPLTTDYAYLKHALDAVAVDSAPAGETDIGDAIIKSMEILKKDERAHKAIILISDGEDLTGKALAAAKEAGQHNIPIFTVGLGSSSGSRIPEQEKSRNFLKYRNEDIVTKLNDKTMHEIAEATRGAYIPVGTASMTSTTLGMLYRNHLTKLSALDIEETLQRRHVERYQLFLLPAFLLFLAATFLSRGRLAATTHVTSQLKDLTPPAVPLKKITLLIASFLTLTHDATAQTNSIKNEQPEPEVIASTITNKTPALNVPPGREGARMAQKYYFTGKYQEAAGIYLEALKGASDEAQQDFRFNAAVSLFKAEKYSDAADILKDLFQKGKSGQTEYAKALGAALYRSADIPKEADYSKISDRARLLHESGEAFKDAVRSAPDNSQSRKNLAVILDKLPAAEEQAKTAELMAKFEQVPAQQIADQMLQTQRKIVSEIPVAFTNESPSQIKTLEIIAETEKKNADLWIPLKGKLLNSMAQQQNKDPKIQQQLAAFEQLVEATRAQMKDSSAALRDLDTAGYNSAAVSENNIYQFWKSIAAFESILQEDIRRQTNAINMVSREKLQNQTTTKPANAEQDEALNLTDLFAKRFAESIPETGETPPPDSKAEIGKDKKDPGVSQPEKQLITAETRKTILNLASQASTAQKSASSFISTNNFTSSLLEQKKAHSLLKEIEKLLPKNKTSNQQDQQENKDKKEQQQKDQKEQQNNQQEQNQPQQQQQEEQKKEQQVEEKNAQQEKNKDELSAEQLKKLLEKAAQRESEHEAKKRERNRSIPMSPIDRDW